MLVYVILYGLLFATFALLPIFIENPKKSRRLFCAVAFVLLFLLIALRHPSMGVDLVYGSTKGYLGRFSYIATLSWKDVFTKSIANYERGYIIFNKLVSLISDDPQFLLAICSLICFVPFILVVYSKSTMPFLSVIIYLGLPCFLIVYSGLRQAIAISFTLIAFLFIQKKKIIPFVLFTVLAYFFHTSAILFLIAYPIYYIKSNNIIFKLVSLAFIPIVYIFRYPLFTLLSQLVKPDAVAENNSSVLLFIVFICIYIFTIFMGHSDEDVKENGYRNLFYVACICQAFSGVYSIAMRVGYYFMIYLTLLLPEILTNKTTYNTEVSEKGGAVITHYEHTALQNIMCIGIIICFAAFGFYSIYTGSWAKSYPYRFFWN